MYPGVEQLQAIRPQVILNIKLRFVKKEEKERKKETKNMLFNSA